MFYEITASVPAGATADQVKTMLRNLLTERFHLTFHRERVERQGFALVASKVGIRMKESAPDDSPMPAKPVVDPDGFV